MPSPTLGHARKHSNHLALLNHDGGSATRAPATGTSLRSVYELILWYPGLGPFLAFQYAIDLNYSCILSFQESEFVVAGPGALDGISKCFIDTEVLTAEEVIYWVTERQDAEFSVSG